MLTINTSDYALRRHREAALGLYGALDSKRPAAWQQYGYPTEVTFAHLLTAYERGGPGHGAVHRILDKCWQERPRIKRPESDAETPWEVKLNALITGIRGWAKLRDFDRRNMVGRYAGLLYRVADGRRLSEPLQRGVRLVDLVPVFEDQLRVTAWNSDPASEDYGRPSMWQYRMRRPTATDTQGAPDEWQDVHPSRVQLLAEGSVGDFLEGVPLLRPGFNHLVDLEKISGGSAESFLKNSARTLVLQFDAMANPASLAATPGEGTPSDIKGAIEDKVRDLNRNIDSSIVLQGGEASTLQTTVADPGPSFEVAANLFAASVQIPFTILFGQQTGRMASDEDKADMIARCKSRQVNELTPMLEELVRRLQAAGLVEAGEFEVEWPPLDAPGDKDKMALALQMADVNVRAFQAGAMPVYTTDEVRKASGYEPGEGPDPDLPVENDPAEDDEGAPGIAAR